MRLENIVSRERLGFNKPIVWTFSRQTRSCFGRADARREKGDMERQVKADLQQFVRLYDNIKSYLFA